ncbi:hypothetical protein VR46_35220, partial [Streptomyces sp. NRRL S-444]
AAPVSVAALVPYRHLTELVLIRCVFEGTLEPLTELPGLRLLVLRECLGTLDLSPFADVDGLVIEVDRRTSVVGTERIPPERLVYKS